MTPEVRRVILNAPKRPRLRFPPHPHHDSYSHPQTNAAGKRVSLMRIMRGKLRDGALVEQQTVFQTPADMYPGAGGVHVGGRLVFDRADYLFFTIGERGTGENAQDLSVATTAGLSSLTA